MVAAVITIYLLDNDLVHSTAIGTIAIDEHGKAVRIEGDSKYHSRFLRMLWRRSMYWGGGEGRGWREAVDSVMKYLATQTLTGGEVKEYAVQ